MSRNLLTLCGIVTYLIQQGKSSRFLLSLPEVVGGHTGANITKGVAITREFGL